MVSTRLTSILLTETKIMKALQVTTAALTIFIICTGQVEAKGKPGGGNPPPPVSTSCADKASYFPSFVYSQNKTNRKGQISGNDLFLSNAAGDCQILIYSSSVSTLVSLNYKQIGTEGIVVWAQSVDENAGR